MVLSMVLSLTQGFFCSLLVVWVASFPELSEQTNIAALMSIL